MNGITLIVAINLLLLPPSEFVDVGERQLDELQTLENSGDFLSVISRHESEDLRDMPASLRDDTVNAVGKSFGQKRRHRVKKRRKLAPTERQREMERLREEAHLVEVAEHERLQEDRQRRREEKMRLREEKKALRAEKIRQKILRATETGTEEWLRGDLSCMRRTFVPAPRVDNADVKYIKNDALGAENAFLEAQYRCREGFQMHLDGNSSTRTFCRHRSWIGQTPKCIRIETTVLVKKLEKTCDQKECDQLCFVDDNGNETCSCFRGFRMVDGICMDVNECTESESPCEFECHNTPGSFRCKCPKGLRLEGNSCVDVNECLLRNGHGPCQDFCHNTHGSWFCSCRPDAKLAEDGQSCEFVDQCTVSNGNCSHVCHSLMGTAFCDCPDGWRLGQDGRTCQDVNECEEAAEDGRLCAFECVNTPGGYKCIDDEPPEETQILLTTCPIGFTFNSATRECEDVDECQDDNGGCHQKCSNTMGSFHCSCHSNFIFTDDKITCRALDVSGNASLNVICPPLFPPRHGYLECSREGSDREQQHVREAARVSNSPGSLCELRCPGGFRLSGSFSVQCDTQGQWRGQQDGVCIKYPTPHLTCPPDIRLEIPPGEDSVTVEVSPRTDSAIVESLPSWVLAQSGQLHLQPGDLNVTYIARHPISRISVSCAFSIIVLDGQPPSVTFCPAAQRHTLDDNSSSIAVTWPEPSFTDNINVSDVTRTNAPGNLFGVGSHLVTYTARDEAGWSTKCSFKILIVSSMRRLQEQFVRQQLPKYHELY
ncbi:sushi, von Willebrand factor type A, EGF and pentraxin domain-containing protein 1 [Phlebotomus argentipes]|uniref:sushi, von Willebrand factor type A, EGF and pentraxin domain-containing protein 1 n=1 Tax=Phlebotomus argentipes TaxID=94469 RepID=UPI0028937B17|nr:sushi, von Willebrand factor type A, EGF and pentraxin domain-containing protein 1 [Phlebotomus argentipes]